VVCITHLPQVASLASTHFRLEKDRGEPARATVQQLAGEGVVDEIRRMLGDEGDAAERHARELLAAA
jgi:DNA repair protein RecN (Recombination protein N)